jgi:hypothetical protein
VNSEDEIVELAAWGLDESRDRGDGIAADSLTRLQYRLLRSNVFEVPAVIVHARSLEELGILQPWFFPEETFLPKATGRHGLFVRASRSPLASAATPESRSSNNHAALRTHEL